MKKRMFLMLLAVFVFLTLIGGFKFFQVKAAIAKGKAYQAPPEAVTTTVARQEEWDTTLNAIGTVQAVHGVTVAADLPGTIAEILFRSGQAVNEGDVLVRLDTRQERAQLAAAEAQRELTRVALDRQKGLLAQGITSQAAYDQAAAEFKQADAGVGEIKATIDRKTIRAPFAGTLGIRLVNLGEYLAGGAPIVPLQSLQPAYVEFSVPQQELRGLRVGGVVRATSDGFNGLESGAVTAIDSVVDPSTRNVRVQATFANRGGRLRPGMFVETKLEQGKRMPVITLPASAISYAPFGDSVFIVENVKAADGKSYRGVRQQFVKLGASRGDQVAVLSGVKPGEEVVTSGVFKLRPGSAVLVNNSVQPSNSSAPKPEDS
ncbi:MAG TPA: efflux RND transporter periplasmic adaptor subunit [Thermoanaerobaculia bacterium]|nr:efflux RND transporter periplasmic adaptor subunit [Thermoanaerobaculia bacterium]